MSDRAMTGPAGGGFVARAQLLDATAVRRALRRMAHEIVERNADVPVLVVLGLQHGGVALGEFLARELTELSPTTVASGSIDVAFHRDDLDRRPLRGPQTTSIPVDLTDAVVVLVDDVLFTGRTIRAALNALAEWGRPRAIQLAVLVDRGHRELPIRADYVGKNVPTSRREAVVATPEGVWIGERHGDEEAGE